MINYFYFVHFIEIWSAQQKRLKISWKSCMMMKKEAKANSEKVLKRKISPVHIRSE